MTALASAVFWTLGAVGGALFYGRFYVQWIVSERRKQVVIPISFWYMSSVGSILVFAYSIWNQSPGAAFGLCFNILIYSRNLVHIWNERGALTRARYVGIHALAVGFAMIAVGFTVYVWWREIHINHHLDPAQAKLNWFWLKMWGVGQICFFLRFAIQWLVTEMKRKSVVPAAFWYLSVIAALFQAPSFFFRRDWINFAGQVANIFVYVRNLWLARRTPPDAEPAPAQ